MTIDKSSRYIQFGCGMHPAPGWRNFDASPTLRFEKLPLIGQLFTKNNTRFPPEVEYGDIVRGLPISESYCKGVYCSHVLEHLALEDFKTALSNTFKIIQPRGLFRLVVPDLQSLIDQYKNDNSVDAAPNFMEATLLGHRKRNRSITSFFKEFLGNSNHLWMWDFKSMQKELEICGFTNIRRAHHGDSENPNFQLAESKDRRQTALA